MLLDRFISDAEAAKQRIRRSLALVGRVRQQQTSRLLAAPYRASRQLMNSSAALRLAKYHPVCVIRRNIQNTHSSAYGLHTDSSKIRKRGMTARQPDERGERFIHPPQLMASSFHSNARLDVGYATFTGFKFNMLLIYCSSASTCTIYILGLHL